MFTSPPWKHEPLQKLKAELNKVKSCLSNYDLYKWQAHTNYRNSAKDVTKQVKLQINPEFLTQAWSKFYEIAAGQGLIPLQHIVQNNNQLKSVHLCEAPGAFVASLNHWLKTNTTGITWDWVAMTFNPYYEGNSLSKMIDDDRFIRHTLEHWYFGEDNTGNLMNIKNLDALKNFCEPCKDILLITADGSIDCMDMPDEQECAVAHLHFCETVAALSLLAAGGNYLLKIFTTFEHQSVCLLYLLSCCFENVRIVKPVTSKEGNSETYVVCQNFRGQGVIANHLEVFRKYYESGYVGAMFSKGDIPETFLSKIVESSEFFKSQQCEVIINNILTFNIVNKAAIYELKKLWHTVAETFIKKYNLKQLTHGRIVENLQFENINIANLWRITYSGSYNERLKKKNLPLVEQLRESLNHASQIDIRMLTNQPVAFQITDLPGALSITLARKFRKLYSSKFCYADALKIRNFIDDILEKLGHKIQFPCLEEPTELPPKYSMLHFDPLQHYDPCIIIDKFLKELKTFKDGETLILLNYPLLTHFNVELLYLLGSTFNSLKIELCDNLGSKIILEHYNHQDKLIKDLVDIELISNDAKENEKIVLRLFPKPYVHDSHLYPTIIDVNHWIIKLYAQLCMHFTSQSDTSALPN